MVVVGVGVGVLTKDKDRPDRKEGGNFVALAAVGKLMTMMIMLRMWENLRNYLWVLCLGFAVYHRLDSLPQVGLQPALSVCCFHLLRL